jgi:dihydroorotase-like cyclic amidohydrolase
LIERRQDKFGKMQFATDENQMHTDEDKTRIKYSWNGILSVSTAFALSVLLILNMLFF